MQAEQQTSPCPPGAAASGRAAVTPPDGDAEPGAETGRAILAEAAAASARRWASGWSPPTPSAAWRTTASAPWSTTSTSASCSPTQPARATPARWRRWPGG